jgi:N-acetylglucosaminyldiphosphoundecaprenol N-acetyl-beta-D-mannosaminyltransferase
MIATVNVDFLMQAFSDPELHEILLSADLVVADGAPIVALSECFGPRLRERVTGSDLSPRLAKACANRRMSVFLLGAAPGVASEAARVLKGRYPSLRVAGTYSPPKAGLRELDHAEMLSRLEAAAPDLLLVALGAPKQEKFISRSLARWRVPLAVGVGGTLDFLAGVQWRAPKCVQKIGMEALWRLCTDPLRLMGRYSRNFVFLFTTLFRLFLLKAMAAVPRVCDSGRPAADFGAEFEAMGVLVLELHQLSARSWSDEKEGVIVVVDAGPRRWMDSDALADVISASRALRNVGGTLVLICRSGPFRAFLRACHLDRFMEIFRGAECALCALRGCRKGWVRKPRHEASEGKGDGNGFGSRCFH